MDARYGREHQSGPLPVLNHDIEGRLGDLTAHAHDENVLIPDIQHDQSRTAFRPGGVGEGKREKHDFPWTVVFHDLQSSLS